MIPGPGALDFNDQWPGRGEVPLLGDCGRGGVYIRFLYPARMIFMFYEHLYRAPYFKYNGTRVGQNQASLKRGLAMLGVTT